MTDSYSWATRFRDLFDHCVGKYRGGDVRHEGWFGREDLEFLASIGCKPREFFDFVEDHCAAGGDEPSRETALLIAAARRDYFLVEQKGAISDRTLPAAELPPKPAELEGIPWLPRIIAKAGAKLRGEMDPDTMFGCGGDRAFCSRHRIHPADFLRVVWAARGDTGRILQFVKTGRMGG